MRLTAEALSCQRSGRPVFAEISFAVEAGGALLLTGRNGAGKSSLLLILAGLQVIPSDIYEAAKVDGATAWQRFRKITLPLLTPAILVALIFRTLDALRIFDLIWVLTPKSEGTITMSVISFENIRDFGNYGEGSAQSTMLFAIIAVFIALYIWLGKVDLSGERNK